MSSSRRIIKADTVTLQPLKGGGGDFIQAAWEHRGGEADSLYPSEGMAGSPSEEVLKEAYEQGYRAGVEDQKRRTGTRDASVVVMLEKVHGRCQDLKNQLQGAIEGDVVTLAFALAEKIIRREISLNRRIITDALADILKDIKDKTDLVIRLHPEDETVLKEYGLGILDNDGLVTVAADATLLPGDMIVETRGRLVDVRILEQLDILRESLPDRESSGAL